MKQCDRIMAHLKEYGSITALEAVNRYGIIRLASRVWDLKNCGHDIRREMVSGENRYGEKVCYARYYLGGNEND